MPRFGLKQLFLCVTLIAIGVAMLAFTYSPYDRSESLNHLRLRVIFGVMSGAFIGAGIGAPFKRAGAGAVIGQLALICGLILYGIFFAIKARY